MKVGGEVVRFILASITNVHLEIMVLLGYKRSFENGSEVRLERRGE